MKKLTALVLAVLFVSWSSPSMSAEYDPQHTMLALNMAIVSVHRILTTESRVVLEEGYSSSINNLSLGSIESDKDMTELYRDMLSIISRKRIGEEYSKRLRSYYDVAEQRRITYALSNVRLAEAKHKALQRAIDDTSNGINIIKSKQKLTWLYIILVMLAFLIAFVITTYLFNKKISLENFIKFLACATFLFATIILFKVVLFLGGVMLILAITFHSLKWKINLEKWKNNLKKFMIFLAWIFFIVATITAIFLIFNGREALYEAFEPIWEKITRILGMVIVLPFFFVFGAIGEPPEGPCPHYSRNCCEGCPEISPYDKQDIDFYTSLYMCKALNRYIDPNKPPEENI